MKLGKIIRAVILWTLVTALTYGVFYIGSSIYNIFGAYEHVPLDEDDLGISDDAILDEEIINIALFGLDARYEDEGSRSDAMMILSIDTADGEVKLCSLMRDSYVNIEGYGMDKLAHAYAYGGETLAVKTINQNFAMDITDFATVNFEQMTEIIDILGGVEIELSEAEVDDANRIMSDLSKETGAEYDKIEEAGLQVLSGAQAVAYGRIRYVDSDWYRVERQQEVLEKMMEKAMELSPLKYPELLAEIMPHVTTSLAADEILSIGTSILTKGKPEIYHATFPRPSDVKSVNYNLTYSDPLAQAKLHAFLYDDVPEEELDDITLD